MPLYDGVSCNSPASSYACIVISFNMLLRVYPSSSYHVQIYKARYLQCQYQRHTILKF